MLQVLVTILFVGAFFILFFKPEMQLKNKKEPDPEPTTATGFIADTHRDPFLDHFVPPIYGDIGTFVAYSSVPEDNWLHGFPHKETKEENSKGDDPS